MNKLREFRLKKKWRQFDLAAKSGVTFSLISPIELGYRPELQTKEKLAKALGVKVKDIWPED